MLISYRPSWSQYRGGQRGLLLGAQLQQAFKPVNVGCRRALAEARQDNAALAAGISGSGAAYARRARDTAGCERDVEEPLQSIAAAEEVAGAALSARLAAEERVRGLARAPYLRTGPS